MPQSEPAVQARVLVLPHPDLHPLLHVGHRFVGVVLVGRQRSARPRLARRHDSTDNGHADDWHQQFPTARLLHKGTERSARVLQILIFKNCILTNR